MIFKIFTPSSKVHAQRNVMRETDERLVKYSKRGVLLNVVIFTSALLVGEYYHQRPLMSLVLVGGLICITLIRGYFLVRFEALYAQAPGRWRNLFFFFSLLGSSWWGVILVNFTLVNGFQHETPVLWLYSVGFFAASVYIFAPYERFLTIYMFLSFIPSTLAAFYLLEPISILYGVIMMALYLLLSRQGRVIGQNYWGRLQASYDLTKRANILEAEKITTESSLNNRDILFKNLTGELKASIQEILGSLQLLKYSELVDDDKQLVALSEQKAQEQLTILQNVDELSYIKEIILDQEVVDPRYHIEKAMSRVSLTTYKKNIELYSAFAKDFPMRLRGDPERLEQLVSNLVSSACQFSKSGDLLVSCSFRFEADPGWLKISIINKNPINTQESVANINNAFSPYYVTDIHLGLHLAIVKGLAQAMQGDAGASYRDDGSLIFWVSVRLPTVSSSNKNKQPLVKLNGKGVILYQPPKIIEDVFCHTLEDWGLHVEVMADEQEVLAKLEEEEERYHLVIIYTLLEDLGALSLSKRLAQHQKFWSLPQVLMLSQLQNQLTNVEQHLSQYSNIEVMYKPVRQRRLKKMIKKLLLEPTESQLLNNQKEDFLTGKVVLLFQQEDIDIALTKAMLNQLGCEVVTAQTIGDSLTLLGQRPFDVFISESHIEDIDLKPFIEQGKELNNGLHPSGYKIPVLGLTRREQAGEEAQCLSSGMEYYIDSPGSIDDLRAILRRFISRAVHMSENKRSDHGGL